MKFISVFVSVLACLHYIVNGSPGPGYNINLAHPNSVALNTNITTVLPPYWLCPSGTEYILLPVANQQVNDPNTYSGQGFMAAFRVMGCCQPNSTACMTNKNSQIQGCCPRGSVCCFNNLGIKIGCASSLNQCCNNAICPTGFGCCGYSPLLIPQQAVASPGPPPPPQVRTKNYIGEFQCCPLPFGADINTQSTYCQMNATSGFPMGCQLAYAQANTTYCPYYQYVGFVGPAPPNPNPFVIDVPVPCSYDGNQNATRLCANMTIKCPSTNQCTYVSQVSTVYVFNTTTNISDPYLVNSSIVNGCCPVGYTMCNGINERDAYIYGGCANPSIGETCCGPQICPNGTSCCTKVVPITKTDPFTSLTVTTNVTFALGCCPPQLQCCTQSIRTSGRQNAYRDPFFCGTAYNGANCTLDKWKEPFWYNLIQTQNNGLIQGLTP